MKKGFTMIELIFVIVILGILASVAIPRLAGTREDAEISSAIANLRTLVSDANVYYVTKGDLKKKGSATENAKWSDITSVPLVSADADTAISAVAKLKVGGQECIGVKLAEKAGDTPAHIQFTKVTPTGRIRIDCNDGQYDKYGKIMGQKNIWDTHSYLTIPTDEDIKRIEENNTIAKALYMVRELNKDNLDYDRAVKIMEILQ